MLQQIGESYRSLATVAQNGFEKVAVSPIIVSPVFKYPYTFGRGYFVQKGPALKDCLPLSDIYNVEGHVSLILRTSLYPDALPRLRKVLPSRE